MALEFEVGIMSEIGPIRPINADSALADLTNRFFAIADGVGSTDSSQEASKFAVDTAQKHFVAAIQQQATPPDSKHLFNSVKADYDAYFQARTKRPSTTITVANTSSIRTASKFSNHGA